MTVYGARVSYFTGKFETYLRYREIAYEYRSLDAFHYRFVIPRKLGATQYPSVRLADGRWMSDTTPMIAWLERERPGAEVIPHDPALGFISLLIEDYADEWLWRPAMHYRWNNRADARLASTRLAEEIVRLPAPLELRRRFVARRQKTLFVSGDGVDARTRPHADRAYIRLLECLEPILSARPFLLGERPTIADIGLMGPFWRHFVHDPTPARLMQERAPSVFEWAARTWNARAGRIGERDLVSDVPRDLSPLLREIGETHLQALAANAAAHSAGAATHDLPVQGTTYRGVPTSAYRVWCLEQLRGRYEAMETGAADRVRSILEQHGCWEPLWRIEPIASGHDPRGEAPFCSALRMVRD